MGLYSVVFNMNLSSLHLWRPFLFSVLVVAAVASKFLHLIQHVSSVSFFSFVLYFPTFFFQDCCLVVIARLLLSGGPCLRGAIGFLVGAFLSVICLGAASAQLGFYYVTGGEIRWETTKSMAGDPAAIKLLMSGIFPVGMAAISLLAIAALTTPVLYNTVGFWIQTVKKLLVLGNIDMALPTLHTKSSQPRRRVTCSWPSGFLVAALSLTGLRLMRPPKPYDHMSTTLPLVLTKVLQAKKSRSCDSNVMNARPVEESFPLPDLIADKFWEMPSGNFKGWAPGSNNILSSQYAESRPEWLPEDASWLAGFDRWTSRLSSDAGDDGNKSTAGSSSGSTDRQKCPGDDRVTSYYNPVADPLRITNLHEYPYKSLEKAFHDSDAVISHIVLVTMESARKDMFPLKQGSYVHEQILKSHGDGDFSDVENDLAQLTPVAEQLTGESFRLNSSNAQGQTGPQQPLPSGVWQDPAGPGMGGINVVGAMTGSSLSFKSVLGSHCGVGPLPVDFLEEVDAEIYQPCIPQLLKLFNAAKTPSHLDSGSREEDEGKSASASDYRARVHGREWVSTFTQSITDTFDSQDELNEQMSFDRSVARHTLQDPEAAHYPPTEPEVNYFGYSEDQVKPYIRDIIEEAATNNTRLFLSHMTSTTHHPWAVPDDFEYVDYMGEGSSHDDFNDYLNTVRYDDIWLGELLQLLEEFQIANETLVVVVGDHGQAFEEDCELTGTYENGHISNFRVPLIFRHPHLPRVRVEANATSMSILPTILDLLVQTNSLDKHDTMAAKDLMHEYEGQSLLRPYKTQHNGRQAWNFGVINAGGNLLAVTSAAAPYRLVIPLSPDFEYRFTHLGIDPNELHPVEEWELEDLQGSVTQQYGEQAAKWAVEANAVGRWWSGEMHRLW